MSFLTPLSIIFKIVSEKPRTHMYAKHMGTMPFFHNVVCDDGGNRRPANLITSAPFTPGEIYQRRVYKDPDYSSGSMAVFVDIEGFSSSKPLHLPETLSSHKDV